MKKQRKTLKQFKQLMKNKEHKNKEFGGVIQNDKKNYPPIGEWSQEKPEISDKCIGCGQCAKFCPENTIAMEEKDGKKRAEVDPEFCKGCRLCAEICPVKAIKMVEI